MKKIFSLFMMAILVFAIAACSKPGDDKAADDNSKDKKEPVATEEITPEEGAELLVWSSGGAELEWTQAVADEFNKKYGINVTVEEVGQTDAPGKLVTDGPAGLGADVFMGAHDHTGSMDASGLILENYWPEEYQNDFLDATIQGTTVNDTLYGYPLAIETYALFYNKDLTDKPAATMDELIEQAKAFTNTDENKYGFMMEVGNFYFTYSFIGGYGGYVFGDNNTNPDELGLNNEGAVKAGELMVKLHDEVLPLKNEDITYDVKQSLFNEGKLMYNIDGPWALAAHKEAGVNFGVVPLPTLDNGEHPKSFSGVKAFYVNAYSKYPDAASLFAKFATTDEMLLKRFEMTGQLPPTKALLENEKIKNDEYVAPFLEQAKYAVPMPNITEMQSVWGPMGTAFVAIWNGDQAPKEALDAATQQIKDAIASQTK